MPFIGSVSGSRGGRIFSLGGKPAAVGAVSLAAGDATDTFSWSAPQNNGVPITKYAYQVSSDNGSTWYSSIGGTLNGETETSNLSVALSTQYSLSSYKIRVRAFNAVGWGEYSSASSSATAAWTNNTGTETETDTVCGPAGCSETETDTVCGPAGCSETETASCNCGSQSRSRTRTSSRTRTRTRTSSRTRTRTYQYYSRAGSTTSSTTYGTWSAWSDYTYSAWSAYSAWSDYTYSAWSAWSAWAGCTAEGAVTTDGNYNGNYYYGFYDNQGQIAMTRGEQTGCGPSCYVIAYDIYSCTIGGSTTYRIVQRSGCWSIGGPKCP